jgi:excisionase family DNA binding protein
LQPLRHIDYQLPSPYLRGVSTPPEGVPDLLNIAEAAEFLRVSEESLRRWTNAGRLACLRVGGRRERRFRRQDLLAFLEQQPATDATTAATTSRRNAVIGGTAFQSGTHLATLYRNDGARVGQAADFLADAFRPGVVSFLVGGLESRTELVAHLERGRRSLRTEIETGQLVLTDHVHSKEAQLEYFDNAFNSAMRAGARSFRVVGDMSALARLITPEELVAFEAGFERIVAPRFPVVTLCQYDVRSFSALEVLNALEGHPHDFRYPTERLIG